MRVSPAPPSCRSRRCNAWSMTELGLQPSERDGFSLGVFEPPLGFGHVGRVLLGLPFLFPLSREKGLVLIFGDDAKLPAVNPQRSNGHITPHTLLAASRWRPWNLICSTAAASKGRLRPFSED